MTPPELRRRLFDVNALVALALTTHVHHRAAHRALATATGGWATCPLTESGLLRLMLNPAVTGVRFTTREVIDVLAGMRTHPDWAFLHDTVSPAAPLIDHSVLVGHTQVTDFHLVDLAARNDVVLATFDARLATSLVPADRRHVEVLQP
ncbi:MAG TPA: TA system VapC family ribonuclease toxin [Jiangellaceae bacterium]|nr:TA system VapC family ribonuclease toxin [Jiangellaceae bacterium]